MSSTTIMGPEQRGHGGWLAAVAVGEEAEVADADQAFGQNLDEKAAQELLGGNGHDLVLAAVSIVSPAEGDAMVLESHEAMVGDGDAMGIAGQVVENMFSTAEGWLGVDDPVLSAELPEEMVEAAVTSATGARADAQSKPLHFRWWNWIVLSGDFHPKWVAG
jgi:hypothetical protein